MTTFVDTSAFYALLDEDDARHEVAVEWLAGPASDPGELLITHSYVVVEAASLVHRRLGAAATRVLLQDLMSTIQTIYVYEDVYTGAMNALLAAARRRVSFVDWMSFEVMRRNGVRQAFAFDRDFHAQGFTTVP